MTLSSAARCACGGRSSPLSVQTTRCVTTFNRLWYVCCVIISAASSAYASPLPASVLGDKNERTFGQLLTSNVFLKDVSQIVYKIAKTATDGRNSGIAGMKRKAKAMGTTQSSDIASRHEEVPSAGPPASLSQESVFPVPLEILEEILLNLPPDQVVCVCRLVCRQWKEVADSESLWRERCRRERYRLRDASKTPDDWRLFYFLCKKRRNLLKNPRAEHKMKNWQILENGGDRWKIEGVMVPHPNNTVQKNFVTSYGMCKKSQLIDLASEGYNPSFMDHFQPDIKISDWYAPRWDCGSEYEIHVELLNQRKKPVQTFQPETIIFEQWNDQKWNQMTHVFQNYGPGVRYIRFTHGGKDTQFWAGWFGIRVTDSCVEICPAVDT